MKKYLIAGEKRKKKIPEHEKLHDGPMIIQDDHVSPEMCENELGGIYDRRKEQCIVHEEDLPDGRKIIGKSNVKIIRKARRTEEVSKELPKDTPEE